jgi:hypothetical protein
MMMIIIIIIMIIIIKCMYKSPFQRKLLLCRLIFDLLLSSKD